MGFWKSHLIIWVILVSSMGYGILVGAQEVESDQEITDLEAVISELYSLESGLFSEWDDILSEGIDLESIGIEIPEEPSVENSDVKKIDEIVEEIQEDTDAEARSVASEPAEPELPEVEAQSLNPKSSDAFDFLNNGQGKAGLDQFTGTLSYSVPIFTPSGQSGIEPLLTLGYSSNTKGFQSLYGYGWDMSIGRIYRSTRTGANNLYSANDFSYEIFGGSGELSRIGDDPSIFGAKREGGFTRFEKFNDQWIATDTSGTKYFFGQDLQSRHVDPSDSAKVFSWLLNRIEDQNGNYMTISYYSEAGQIYPETIIYTGHGSDPGKYKVKFVRTPRSTYISYQTGFKAETKYQISSIELSEVSGSTDTLRARYVLNYEQKSAAINHLKSIAMEAADGARMPSTDFHYYSGSENIEGKRINLLSQVRTPFGATEKFFYKPSTKYKDSTNGLANKLPFVVFTLERRETQESDNAPISITKYTYSGGRYHIDENPHKNEFAGFHVVESTNPVGTKVTNYFHQSHRRGSFGLSSDAFEDHLAKKGLVYRSKLSDKDGNIYKVSESKWDMNDLTTAYGDRFFSYLTDTTKAIYNDVEEHVASATSYLYDHFGNMTHKTDFGEVKLGQSLATYGDIGSTTVSQSFTYLSDNESNIRSLIASSTVSDKLGDIIRHGRYFYDGLDLGELSKGNLSRSEFSMDETNTTWIGSSQKHDSRGRVIEVLDPRGATTTIDYRELDSYPAKITNVLGHAIEYKYNDFYGKVIQIKDPNGTLSSVVLDSLGRPTESSITGSSPEKLTSTSYDLDSRPISVTQVNHLSDEISVGSVAYFDGLGRIVQTKSDHQDQYIARDYEYNNRGLLARESLPYISPSSERTSATTGPHLWSDKEYDLIGRITSETNVLGTTQFEYDYRNVTITDAEGKKKTLKNDAFEQLVEVVEHNNGEQYSTKYEYDAAGQLAKVTDALGNIRGLLYDNLGRLFVAEDLHKPGSTYFRTLYGYDKAGNLTTKMPGSGKRIDYTYDALNRVTSEDWKSAEGLEFTYAYDKGANAIGKLTLASSTGATKSFGYDLLGRVSIASYIVEGETYTFTFEYDRQGNIKSMKYPDQTEVKYTFNKTGLIDSVSVGEEEIVTNVDYNAVGIPTAVVLANGTTIQNIHNPEDMYRLSHKKTTGPNGIIQDISYVYDKVGNIKTIRDQAEGPTQKEVTYVYDDLHRLLEANATYANATSSYTSTYQYDAIGNILKTSDNGQYKYEGLLPHAVTSVGSTTFAYDSNGNMVSDGDWKHTWTPKDELAGSVKGEEQNLKYLYDEVGQRVVKSNEAKNTKTIYIDKFYEVSDKGAKSYIFLGDTRIATINDLSKKLEGDFGGEEGGVDVVEHKDVKNLKMKVVWPRRRYEAPKDVSVSLKNGEIVVEVETTYNRRNRSGTSWSGDFTLEDIEANKSYPVRLEWARGYGSRTYNYKRSLGNIKVEEGGTILSNFRRSYVQLKGLEIVHSSVEVPVAEASDEPVEPEEPEIVKVDLKASIGSSVTRREFLRSASFEVVDGKIQAKYRTDYTRRGGKRWSRNFTLKNLTEDRYEIELQTQRRYSRRRPHSKRDYKIGALVRQGDTYVFEKGRHYRYLNFNILKHEN